MFIHFRVACMYFNYSTTTLAVVSYSLLHCLNVSSLRGYTVSYRNLKKEMNCALF